jgi:hypothetical protein
MPAWLAIRKRPGIEWACTLYGSVLERRPIVGRVLFSKYGVYLFIYFAVGFAIYGVPPYHLDSSNTLGQLLAWSVHVFLWPLWLVVRDVNINL